VISQSEAMSYFGARKRLRGVTVMRNGVPWDGLRVKQGDTTELKAQGLGGDDTKLTFEDESGVYIPKN
jgi:hypothetical protein